MKFRYIIVTFLVASALFGYLKESPNPTRRSASSQDSFNCLYSASQFFSKALAKSLKEDLPYYQNELHNVFKDLSEYGVWTFRSKNERSILSKLSNRVEGLSKNSTLEDVELAISDGLGARFVLEDTSQTAMHSLFNTLMRAIRNQELKVLEIKNYGLQGGHTYLSDDKIQSLMNASIDLGVDIKIKAGAEAVKSKGYVSLHLKVEALSGKVSEIQFRGELIDQLSEVDHLFYDMVQGKKVPKKLLDDKDIVHASKIMSSLTDQEKEIYSGYLQEYFEYLRKVEQGAKVEMAPNFPVAIRKHELLDVKSLWSLLRPYQDKKSYIKNLRDF